MEGRAHGSVRIASHPSHAARAAVTHKTQTRNPAAPIVRYGVESPLPSPLSYLLQLQPQLHLHLHCQALYKWQWSNSMTLCSLKLSYAPAVALRPSFGPSNNNQSPWSAPLPSPLGSDPHFHSSSEAQNRASCCEPHLRSIFNLNSASPWFPVPVPSSHSLRFPLLFRSFNCAQKINLNNIYAYALFDLNKFLLFSAPPFRES